MPLPYDEIYDRWQRSKSFGDPRDLPTFSTEMNQVTGTNDFDAGASSNWWTRASHAADVNVFNPIADYTGLTAAGRAVGGLFGDPYAETGARVARSLPRTVAQTLPLVAAEVLSGGAATPVVAGALATGGLFGAQTYAETGDPTAAAISGATAAALPAVGRIGGEIGLRVLGPEVENVLTKVKPLFGAERTVSQTLPVDAGQALRYKASKFLGSQVGMIGAMEASSAAQAKQLGQPFDPLSPEFLAQQIPFSFLDLVQTARAKVPTAGQAKIPPILPKPREYVPPKGEPVEEANLQDMLDRMTSIAKDMNVTPEEKSKAFSDTLKVVMNPEAMGVPKQDRVILIGHPKVMENGSIKLLGVASKYYDLPEHSNVFINNPQSATQMVNPDGSVTFITDRKNVNSNVKYPNKPEDFPALRSQKGQVQLPQEPQAPIEGGGIDPTTDLLSLRQKFHQVTGNKTMLDAMVAKEPNDPDQAVAYWQQAIDKMTPTHLREDYKSPFDAGEQQVMREAGVEPTDLPAAALQFPDGRIFTGGTHGHAYLEAEKAGYGDQVPSATGFVKGGQFEPSESITEGMYIDQPVKDVGNDIRKTQELSTQIDQVDKQITDLTGDTLSNATFKYSQRAFGRKHYSVEVDTQLGKLFDQRRELEDQLPESAFELRATTDHLDEMKKSAQKIETSQQQISDAQEKLDLVPKTPEDVFAAVKFAPSGEPRTRLHASDDNPLELIPASVDQETGNVFAGNVTHYNIDFSKPVAKTTLRGPQYDMGWLTKEGTYISREEAWQRTQKYKLERAVKDGASPTQAAEKLRLQTQTPIVDKAKQQVNLSQEDLREQMHEQLLALSQAARGVEEPLVHPKTGKPLTGETEQERALLRAEANKRLKQAGLPVGGVAKVEGAFPEKPQAKYGEPVRDENGKNFKTRALAEAYRDADPDLEGFTVRDDGKKGFYLAKQINKETSIEGAPGTSLENVLKAEDVEDIHTTIAEESTTDAINEPATTEIFTPDAEERPDLSFNDYLGQLDLASENPTRLKNAAGFEDLPTAITAIRQFRVAMTDVFSKGLSSLEDVNKALKEKGVLRFESEREMKDTFRKMRDGMEEFSGKYRSFNLDSQVPHDTALAQEIGILDPQRGALNFLDWFIANTPEGDMRDLVTGLRNTSDFAHVKITNEEGKGFWYRTNDNRMNLNHLPKDREDALNVWGPQVLEEFAHDTMRDLPTRTDPAAVEFKATLNRILKVVRDSKQLPLEVRKAVQLAIKENWYDKGSEVYNQKFDEHLPGRDSWKGVHYSLLNEMELVGGIFNSPELRRILMNTTMPKSPVPILNFFANAWARMFGYTPNAGNAFAKILASYDNYLSGSRNSRGYNGVSYIRDSLVEAGTSSQAMASRLSTVTDTYNQGDLSASIRGFEREMEEGILPATTVAGKLNDTVKDALINGDVKAVAEATGNLLAAEVPQHQELWWRMKEDVKIAQNLLKEAKAGSLYAETSLFQEGLSNQFAKLNAMKNELDRQNGAIARWNTMDSLANSDGMQRLWSGSLQGETPPKPTEQTGNEDVARMALGLEPKSADYIANERRRLAETGEKPLGWVEKMFKFASFTSQEVPAFKPIYQTMLESQANAHRRMAEMEVVRNGDKNGWNKVTANANKRIAETPGLNQIVSDMLRRANVLEKMHQPVDLADGEMQVALRRASDAKRRDGRSDRDDVVTAFNSEGARAKYRVDKVIPEHLDMTNRALTALAIIGREIGMPSEKAIELSERLHSALKQLHDPTAQVQGAENLRAVASQMQPATFTKVLEQTNGFINDSAKHLKMLQQFRFYTGEQRYGNFHLVMSKDGEPYREGFQTEKAARARAKDLKADGWILEDIVPVQKANVSGYLKAEDPLIASQRELDQQTLNRLESVMSDLPLDRQEMLRPLVQRAAEYEASAAAFSPVPTQASPKRKFRAGRETIDMVANAAEETKRFNNWMRHRESRIVTAVHMLDPEMLANRGLKDYATQFIDNQLAADNPVARKINEAAFYWYLAGNFGNDVLESMQSLTTGMASVISETGSVKDAVKYVAGASGKVFKRYATGKWADKNTEWFINWMSARGSLGLPTWGDVFDPTTQNYFDVNRSKNAIGKSLDAVKNGLRGYKALFMRHNDMVGSLAGFQLGRDMGMTLEDAARFAEGVKNRGLYTAGKVQRAVGEFSIKEKAVPQLMGAMKTYIQGFFSQLAHNYKVGFGNAPGDFTPAQRVGAKKAFMYMLGTQATLAGALGLPGIGQALALTKQATGLDIKGWARKNLASMFGEDQDDYGGFLTGLALHGMLSQAAPFDISGRQVNDIPFTGVSSWKGFDMSNIMPVPFSMASDFLGGLMELAKGGDPSKAFPIALRGPVQLIHGQGDIRNSKGDLLYNLSPSERIFKSLGLEPSRVAAAKETASTVKAMNDAAEARKTSSVSAVASLYRRGDTVGAQRRLSQILKENPDYDPTRFVRSVATTVEKQTIPYDWKREVNPALDIAGLANDQPSREMERLQLRQGVQAGLGLYEPPNLRSTMRAASVDQLMNADPYLTRSVALQHLLTTRRLRRPSIALEPPEYQ